VETLQQQITAKAAEFAPISLTEMDEVKLLNRMDTKYTFPLHLLPGLLEELKSGYRLLHIGEKLCTDYETLYFDTPDFYFYTSHHNGKQNRFKVRMRQYIGSGLNYFEIKFKNNKKRTIKTRIRRPDFTENIEGRSSELLHRVAAMESENLVPKLWVYFTRMTFVNHQMNERLTIDMDLHYRFGEKTAEFPNIVIAEVKQDRSQKSMFISLMMKNHIQQVSISKYCLGIATLVDQVKKNNFKVRLNYINKINHVAP
jgi:hypothetical protein